MKTSLFASSRGYQARGGFFHDGEREKNDSGHAGGRQYKEISAELGIEVSALKVFVHRQKHKDVRRSSPV